ncbi:MAG: hypothetical protein JST63_18365 [Bacteroidetes bacterium]|nr:hypothetical protein [Bacteroidota bacterium]
MAIGGLNGFASTEVQNSTFVLQLKFSAKIPPIANTRPVVRHFKQTLRLTIYILTIFAATLLLGFRHFSLPVTITGHLKNSPRDTSAYTEMVLVFVKGDHKILAKSYTDNKGNFEISFTPNKEKSFDFYCTGLGIDTLLIGSVRTFESDTPEMTFYIPGQLKRNAFGKVICPICKRADKVYKIRHSDAPVSTMVISKSGDTTYSPIYKGKFQAGCLVGLARYYCDRDKVKF